MNKVRAFISVDIPKNIQKGITKIQEMLPGFNGKFTETENLHLTLKFLGDVDGETLLETERRLKEINFKSFDTRISEIGVFSPEYVKIVWVKLDNCENLQKAVDEKLSGIFEKEKRFMSHLTIARIKKIKNREDFLEKLEKIKIPLRLNFSVKSFQLKKSELTPEGPVYETLEEYFLL
jgi:2'-5' RNA ligase